MAAASSHWPADGLEHLGCCPVCGGRAGSVVHRDLVDELFHSSGERWVMHACDRCRTNYLDPRPTPQSIARAYAAYLTHGPDEDVVRGRPRRSAFASLLHAWANGYRNARWGMRLQPASALGRWIIPWIPLLRGALVQQMHWLPGPAAPGARLLDVGCGGGEFLELARDAGWKVQGTDFDPAAVATARARGLDVQEGGLEVLQRLPPASFDRISFSHVLEHVHEPLAWLRELNRLLRPGGTLWLQTPNVASLGHARWGRHWRGLEPPRHLTLWAWPTLRTRLEETGFRTIRRLRTPLIIGMELGANSDALRQGLDHAAFAALPLHRQLRPKYAWHALRQHLSLASAEFLTITAVR